MAETSHFELDIKENQSMSDTLQTASKDSTKLAPSASLNEPLSQLLTHQILEHHKEIESFENKLKEILEIQLELFENLSQENQKLDKARLTFNFEPMFNQISHYTKKLHHLRNEMIMIQECTVRLKQRAVAVRKHQEAKALEAQRLKALQEERERLLTARPVWEVDQVTSDNNR